MLSSFRRLSLLVVAALASGSLAAIGPVADLALVNGKVTPDGFTRDAVLAGSTFPGPLITGNKVGLDVGTLPSPPHVSARIGRQLQDQCNGPADKRDHAHRYVYR